MVNKSLEIPAESEEVMIDITPQIPNLPKYKDKTQINVRYMLISPYASVHIYWNEKLSEVIYELEEPLLDRNETDFLAKLEEGMRELINVNLLIEKNKEEMMSYLHKTAKLVLTELGLKVSKESYKRLFYYLYRDFIGLNEIEPLLRDYFIEDIECNGLNTPVYVVHRLYRNLRTNILYSDMERPASFVEKLAQRCGRYISYASPLLDGTLPDGSVEYNEPFIYKEGGIVRISKIGEFIDKFYKKDDSNIPIKVKNIEVPCFNKGTLKIEWKKADYVYRHKNKDEIYKLNLEFGRTISLTPAHSIFVLTKDGLKAEKTSSIKEGDYATIPLRIPGNDVIREFNLAKELAETPYYKKIVIGDVPRRLFLEKKEEIKDYLKSNYKLPYQAYYELRKKGLLPIKLWKIIPAHILRGCRLKTTSSVAIPTYLKVSGELFRLLGYYIAEGWTCDIKKHKRIQFCLAEKEKNLIQDIKNCFIKCFGVPIYVEPTKNNSVKITLNSLLVWLVFNNALKVSHYAKTKEIPEIVFNANKKLQKEFLDAWYAGDFGSTASKKLAEGISYLSLFDSKIVPFYGRARTSYIDNRALTSYEYYTNFFGRPISRFPEMIPIELFNPLNQTHMRFRNKRISRERLKRILNEKRFKRFRNLHGAPIKFLKEWEKRGFLKESSLTEEGKEVIKDIDLINKLLDSDLGFVKIKKITKVKSNSEYVYDVSVPGHENFISGFGGVCCHNSRVNATYTTDITSRGPTYTIRKFTKVPWTPTYLMSIKTLSPEMLAYFWLLLQYKCNILITGGTASGKTTLLNALAFFIPPEARVVSIEDTREINLPRENWLPSVARTGVTGGMGEVDLFTLLKGSFRQNPDYIIVGEVRGKEAFVLFQGMAAGHPSLSTMHADSVETVVRRLETPPIELSPTLVNSLDVVAVMAHAIVEKQETRRLTKIIEVVNVTPEGIAETNTPFMWQPSTDEFFFKTDSTVFEKITARYGISKEQLLEEFDLRTRLMFELFKRKIFGFDEVQKVINDYYKNPALVLGKYNIT